jgi:hypothetical protein
VSCDPVNQSSVYSLKSTCFLFRFISSHVSRRSNPRAETNEDTDNLFSPMSVLQQIALIITWTRGARGGVVVKALRYKSAGRGFDSQCCHWNFSITYSFRSHYGPGVDSTSNRNEYQVYFLGVKAAGA